jgi:hypothetical protein
MTQSGANAREQIEASTATSNRLLPDGVPAMLPAAAFGHPANALTGKIGI